MSEKEIEVLQQNARRRSRIVIGVSAAVLLLLIAFLFWFTTASLGGESLREAEGYDFLDIAIAVLVIPGFLALGLYGLLYILFVKRAYEKFDHAFKQTYVLQTIQQAGGFACLKYEPKNGLSYTEIYDSLLLACGEKKYYESEDLLTGKFEGMPFAYCDLATKYLKHHPKKAEIETIFQGQVMRFTLPEGAKWSFGHLQIFEKEFLSDWKGRTAGAKIKTESESFNSRFQVYAADEHNAFYLLTPKMQEQIMRFADLAGSQIAMTFVGPTLYVAMNRPHSLFDASLSEPIDGQKQNILHDVRLLQQAGRLLALETDMGKAEHA